MTLAAGTRLGPYEIVAPLGAGGMGEVWKARDIRVERVVALKVLPEDFLEGEERKSRFAREARLLASLSHAGIATLYSFEEIAGQNVLSMECVEGSDLAQLLSSGPLSLEESLSWARQIAEALEAAHEKGIVHRDLKPANVKITPDGRVKLLDFGLAKIFEPEGEGKAGSGPPITQSPTLTARATAAGVILGTAAYMSPEQARGKAVDKRTDVWAFGCVLFEMLTGKKAFEGETVTDVLAAILTREPDWSALRAPVSSKVRELLRRCLQRDPKQRLRDIGDARIVLEEETTASTNTGQSPFEEKASVPGPTVGRSDASKRETGSKKAFSLYLPWVLAAAFAGVAGLLALRARPPARAPGPVTRFTLSGLNISTDPRQSLALSPDGSKLVFRARGADGFERLYIRALDSYAAKELPGTEQGGHPFFSPDGGWIGFLGTGMLKKLSLAAGSPQNLCRAGAGFGGGTWLEDGTILFVGDPAAGLQKIKASGGTPETILPLDPKKSGVDFITTPHALPGGKAVLMAVRRGARFDIAVLSLGTRELKLVAEDGFNPAYASGHVLYHQANALLAVPFDLESLSATGPAFPALSGMGTRISYQTQMYSVSRDGTLVYMPQSATVARGVLVWVDRRGAETPVVEFDKPIDFPRLSPDGRKVAFRVPAPNCDVWVHDLGRGATTRLTFEGDNHGVVWSPDGRRIVFARVGVANPEILSEAADGAGSVEHLGTPPTQNSWPSSMSPDGRALLLQSVVKEAGLEIDVLAVGVERVAKPLLHAPFDESEAAFSPDGRFIAYSSSETGRPEVYIQPYPSLDSRLQVSAGGGAEPVWARSGKELFFRQGRKLLSAEVVASPALAAGRPQVLFEGNFLEGPAVANYDVSADGKRLLMVRGRREGSGEELGVVLNWFEELKAAGSGARRP